MARQPLFVVHVIHHLVIGGMENGVVNLINRMPADRFRHAVICIEDFSDFRQRIENPAVEVVAMHRSRIGAWRLRWRLWRLLRRWRADIVHSRNLSGLDALLPARLAGCRTVHSEHGLDVDNLRGQAAKPALLRRLHAPLVDRYVSVSRHLLGLMVDVWRLPRQRIQQIYNGVDTARFQPAARPAHAHALPEGLRGEGLFVVGTVGRAQAVKDQATLLRAAAMLLQRRPALRERLRLALVGDGPLLGDLKALAASLGVDGLTWFAGARSDVAALIQGFDLFVLPSLNEGISNTLLEAMATGLPLLATAVGGNLELLEPGVVGDLFTPGDCDRLAHLIEAYVDDPSLGAAHGAAARQRAVQHFSLQAMMTAYGRLYEGLKAPTPQVGGDGAP